MSHRCVGGILAPEDVGGCEYCQPRESQLAPTKNGGAEMNKLLPCPFCGGHPKMFECTEPSNIGGNCIECQQCGVSSKVFFGECVGLEESWNDRSPIFLEMANVLRLVKSQLDMDEPSNWGFMRQEVNTVLKKSRRFLPRIPT